MPRVPITIRFASACLATRTISSDVWPGVTCRISPWRLDTGIREAGDDLSDQGLGLLRRPEIDLAALVLLELADVEDGHGRSRTSAQIDRRGHGLAALGRTVGRDQDPLEHGTQDTSLWPRPSAR